MSRHKGFRTFRAGVDHEVIVGTLVDEFFSVLKSFGLLDDSDDVISVCHDKHVVNPNGGVVTLRSLLDH